MPTRLEKLITHLTPFLLLSTLSVAAGASSHREAPGITRSPQVDGTDFYMFRSYEPGRADFVSLIANYNPLQEPYGGPNYFPLDTDAFYDLHVNNDSDIGEDITFRFRFSQLNRTLLPLCFLFFLFTFSINSLRSVAGLSAIASLSLH